MPSHRSAAAPIVLDCAGDFVLWRALSRAALMHGLAPEGVVWHDSSNGQGSLNATKLELPAGSPRVLTVPRAFIPLADTVSAHRDPKKWDVLYRVLWKVCLGRDGMPDAGVLSDATDPDVNAAGRMEKAVRFDAHKCKAFVRFRKITGDGSAVPDRYVAWHRPEHRVLRLVAPFFARRFSVMQWTIFTPHESADWNGETLRLGGGVPRGDVVAEDGLEDLWKTYYGSIFNPARIKTGAMLKEMPFRYWSTMPETSIINELLSKAPGRVEAMVSRRVNDVITAAPFVPAGGVTLPQLAKAAQDCEGCDLCELGTQTVFGEGPAHASMMLLGEQPGDEEDRAGRPFIGPAGRLLDSCLSEAGIDRDALYVTNAVKHFNHVLVGSDEEAFDQGSHGDFIPHARGKRRLHKKPSALHVRACRPWLDAELTVISPTLKLIVCLGATAAQALMGPAFRLTDRRGRIIRSQTFPFPLLATWHPSAVLRGKDRASQMRTELIDDLRLATKHAAGSDANGTKGGMFAVPR